MNQSDPIHGGSPWSHEWRHKNLWFTDCTRIEDWANQFRYYITKRHQYEKCTNQRNPGVASRHPVIIDHRHDRSYIWISKDVKGCDHNKHLYQPGSPPYTNYGGETGREPGTNAGKIEEIKRVAGTENALENENGCRKTISVSWRRKKPGVRSCPTILLSLGWPLWWARAESVAKISQNGRNI